MPIGWLADGASSTWLKFVAPGSSGARSGAKIAISTNSEATTSPPTAIGRRPRRLSIRRRARTRGAMATSAALMPAPPRTGCAG